MSIDAKDIQILVGRTLKFSTNVCCRFVQNHPFVSGVLLFSFVLYLFIPKILLFLLYSFPFLACTAVFIRFYFHSQHSKTKNEVKNETKDRANQTADLFSSRNDKTSIQSSKIPDGDSIGGAVLNELKPREITEKDHGKGMSRNVSIGETIAALGEASNSDLTSLDGLEEQAAKYDGGGDTELENSSSEEDDEGQTQGGTNKAVEWTEVDQKNLMDLGLSELERNKRLESLIARRNVRKLFKMQTEKILINVNFDSPIPVAPVLVTRGNPFDVANNPDEQVPGSAPSVLLPTRNPFDLPYDPLEEKPDLTADSFQQEFKAPHQKDFLFCRHQSFILGPSFPLEAKLNGYGIAGNNRLRRQQDNGNHGWLVDNLSNQNGEPLRRSVSVTDLVTGEEEEEGESSNRVRNHSDEEEKADHSEMEIEETKNESSSSSLPEERTRITKPNKLEVLPTVFRFPEMASSPSPSSGFCPIPRARTVNELTYEDSPSTIDRSRLENHLLYTHTRPLHTPTHSIASDMQVEVSEIGSPPLTGDGSASSIDGDSLTYDGDIEKEITSGSDEMWGASPYAPKVEEHEMEFGEVNEVTREDTAGGFPGFHKEPQDPGFSGFHREPRDPVSSPSRINIQMLNEGSSNPPEKFVEEMNISYDSDVPVHEFDDSEVTNSVEDKEDEGEAEKCRTSEVRKPGEEIDSESSKQSERNSLNTLEQSAKELNVACSMDDPVVHMNSGAVENKVDDSVAHINISKIDRRSSEDRDRIEKNIEQEILVELAKRAEESTSEIDKYTESNSGKPPANQTITESSKQITEDGKEERNATEVPVSGVNQSSNASSTSGIQTEMTVEEISSPSTSSSSPKSVLPDGSTSDQTSSDRNQHMHIAAPESDTEGRIVRNKSLDEQALENLAHTAPQGGHHVTDHPSIDSKSEKSEELKNPPREFTQDANGNSGYQDLTEQRTAANPLEPGIPVTIGGGEALLQNSRSINNAVADDITSKERHELVTGGEGESQRLDEKVDTTERSNAMEDPLSGSGWGQN